MMFEKQILSVLRNEVGPDSCNTVLLAGDMNNDGWNDIVVCGKNGRLALLKNGERYRRWERYILDENVEGVGGAAALCDLTGNGYLDIVLCGDETSDQVVWYENPGADQEGEWVKRVAFATGNCGFADMVLADNLLGDGRRCLLMTNLCPDGTQVLCAPLPADA